MQHHNYTLLPQTEMDSVDSGGGIMLNVISEAAPSSKTSSACGPQVCRDHRRHDRRRERLNTELLVALKRGSLQLVTRALGEGASPNATCRSGRVTACHLAALFGFADILQVLLEAGAVSGSRDHSGTQPVHLAAWAGQSACLDLLLRHDKTLIESPVQSVDKCGTTSKAYLDSWSHDHDAIDSLMPKLNEGSTPLHLASQRVNCNCVDLLLEYGALVHCTDIRGLTPLDVAGEDRITVGPEENKTEKEAVAPGFGFLPSGSIISQKSVVSNPDINFKGGRPVARVGNDGGDSRLEGTTSTDNDKAFNYHGGYGDSNGHGVAMGKFGSMGTAFSQTVRSPQPSFTPGMRATNFRSAEIGSSDANLVERNSPMHHVVDLLIGRGAKMLQAKEGEALNRQSVTTLHTAVESGNLALIRTLMENGASLLAWNADGSTPLHLAISLQALEPLTVMLQLDHTAIDCRDSAGRTLLHLAVMLQWEYGVSYLLEAGADVTAACNQGQTVLHDATLKGNHKILEELLSIPDSAKILDHRNQSHETPLFCAAAGGYLACLKLLVAQGADTAVMLPGDVTLLHVAAHNSCQDVLEALLADSRAGPLKDVRCKQDQGGVTALHIAATVGNAGCVGALLTWGCDSVIPTSDRPSLASTALHLAGMAGHDAVVRCILEHDRRSLSTRNLDLWYPLHVAARFGQRDCVRAMLTQGANMAANVTDSLGARRTGLEMIMYCVPQPLAFLEEVFDSYIEVNDYPINNPKCMIKLKYDILVPLGPAKKQLKVLSALLNSGRELLQERLLMHPLVATFLFLKWRKLRIFFMVILAFYLLLTLSLTSLALLIHVYKVTETTAVLASKAVLICSLLPAIVTELINTSRLQRYYLLDLEVWVKWSTFCTAGMVALIDHSNLWWARHLTALAILLAWIQLLFLISNFPRWGYYVFMFFRVATNVLKVLGTFACLLLGFTFAFIVQFQAMGPFSTLWESLVKVLVMTSEFEYTNMFQDIDSSKADGSTMLSLYGRVLFALFVVMVGIVLMNLMVGIAVSDIALLETQGRTKRLAKQVDFLSLLEVFVYNKTIQRCLPGKFGKKLGQCRTVLSFVPIQPGRAARASSTLRTLPNTLRDAILDKVIGLQKADHCGWKEISSKLDRLITKQPSSKLSSRRSSTVSTSETANSSEDKLQRLILEMHELRQDVQQMKRPANILG